MNGSLEPSGGSRRHEPIFKQLSLHRLVSSIIVQIVTTGTGNFVDNIF
jgi:hypothetical protein